MLRLAGIRFHPAARALAGAAVLAIGLARHHATAMIVIGGALLVWGVVGVGGLLLRGAEATERPRG